MASLGIVRCHLPVLTVAAEPALATEVAGQALYGSGSNTVKVMQQAPGTCRGIRGPSSVLTGSRIGVSLGRLVCGRDGGPPRSARP